MPNHHFQEMSCLHLRGSFTLRIEAALFPEAL